MAVYIISYEIQERGQKYDKFIEVIKSYKWMLLGESAYVVDTDKSPGEITQNLGFHLGLNDFMYVLSVSQPYASRGMAGVNQWLEQHLE